MHKHLTYLLKICIGRKAHMIWCIYEAHMIWYIYDTWSGVSMKLTWSGTSMIRGLVHLWYVVWCIYETHASPALNRSSAIHEHGDATKIRLEDTSFYTRLSHVPALCICCIFLLQLDEPHSCFIAGCSWVVSWTPCKVRREFVSDFWSVLISALMHTLLASFPGLQSQLTQWKAW